MKKLLAILLSLVMVIGLVQISVSAASVTVTTADELKTAFGAGGEIVLGADITMENQALVVAVGSSVELDLNGHVLSGYFTGSSGSAIITNNGDFVLKDSVGTGKITMDATNPSGGTVPTYASNAVSNCGVMTMNGGTIENTTVDGYATYCIDNQSNVRDAVLTVNDGTLINDYTDCIRMACISNKANSVTINGGNIKENDPYDRAIWIQIFGNNVPSDISLTVNGGEFVGGISTYSFATGASGYFNAEQAENLNIAISGGSGVFLSHWSLGDSKIAITDGDLLYCDLVFSGDADPELLVTGGEFLDECYAWGIDDLFVCGGIFHADPDSYGEDYLPYLQLMDGYTLCEIDEDVYEVHGAWEPVDASDPTCTELGKVKHFKCTTCGRTYDRDFALVYAMVFHGDDSTGELTDTLFDTEEFDPTNHDYPALGHDMEETVWEHNDSTSGKDSKHLRFCLRDCGYEEEENCNFEIIDILEPTETAEGKIVYQCMDCGYKYEEILKITGKGPVTNPEPTDTNPETSDNTLVFAGLAAMMLASFGAVCFIKKSNAE